MFDRITWYARRLAVMDPAEVLHRIKEQSLLLVLQARYQLGILPGASAVYSRDNFLFSKSQSPLLPELAWDLPSVRKAKDELLSGRWGALGCDWRWTADGDVWHAAPDTGRRWPRRFFSSINYREANDCGDVRIAWEPSRLQQLVALALLVHDPEEDEDRAAVDLICRQLESWIDANPALCGIHYISSMECALRILAVCHSLDLTRGLIPDGDRIWSKVLRMVRDHANLIHQRMSLHSSTGNHTVAESVGLIYAGTLFPEFDEAEAWAETGLRVLGEEADRQILPDGGGVERSLWYHVFVTDLCGLVLALLADNSGAGVGKIRAAVMRARSFLGALAESPDGLPKIGDADNGYALSKYLRMSWSGFYEHRRLTVFESTGISVIRSQDDHGLLYFNHGPLGMAPCYGHGHAHALSVVLKHDGRCLLVDPGTYTYTGDGAWRKYFRGTGAHNTVCVDGEDQAKALAPFMWSNAYRCTLVSERSGSETVALLGFHDGYSRKGVIHWRGVAYQEGCGWVIWDYLSGTGRHELELNWHTKKADMAGEGRFALADDVEMILDCSCIRVTDGADGTTAGWLSDIYGIKYPGATITACYKGELPHEFTTRITIGESRLSDTALMQCLQQFKRIISETKTY